MNEPRARARATRRTSRAVASRKPIGLDGASSNPDTEWRPAGRRVWVSMVDIAYEAVLEAISDRRLAPGSRLDIRDTAERLEMSPTPVREALAKLNAQGLIVLDANRGYRVSGVLTELEFHQLFAARRVIELGALQGRVGDRTHPWIETVTDEDVEEVLDLERAVASSAHGPRYAEYADFTKADSQLHGRFVALARNPFLEQSWSGLHCHLHLSRLYAGAGVIDYDEARSEHAALVQALIDRDVDAVVRASQHHIDMAEERLARLVR